MQNGELRCEREQLGELEKEIELVGSPRSATSHLRQSSKSSFLLDLPPARPPSRAQPVIFFHSLFCSLSAGQEVQSVPHHSAVLAILPIWNKEKRSSRRFARKRNWKLAKALWYLWGIHPTERNLSLDFLNERLRHQHGVRALVMLLHFIWKVALFKAEPISFVDKTAWMLIGFVLTLARQKVQANADAGGKSGVEGGRGSGRLQQQTKHCENFGSFRPKGAGEALENVWWGGIVIMDLDYDCIFSGSIYTGFGWKRDILTVSRVEVKSNLTRCPMSWQGKLEIWTLYPCSCCIGNLSRWCGYICMPLKCGAHLKNPSPSPPSAKLSIKFLIMFSVLPLSTQQPASLLSSFHVEIRPLKQRRVPFSTPQAAQGREGDKGPAVYADLALFARFVRVDPAFYPRIVPLPPSHNLLWTRCTNLSLLESTWIPLFYIWNCNLTFEGGIILVLFFVMITCYGVNNVVIGFIEMFSHVQFNWLGL